ncbi:MAG: dynamin family protein [Ruminiclostridium sp.]|nr:dynamin family protein [Ruminiclostridium sp.]
MRPEMLYPELYELAKEMHSARSRYSEKGVGDFRIVFTGQFSSGKSSLINELLGMDILPVGINPVTKIITRVRYGKEKSYYALKRNGSGKVRLDLDQMKRIVTGKEKLPNGCVELLVYVPSSLLKYSVEIVDTPGYLDDSELDEISKKIVFSCDYVVLCCYSKQLNTEFEKELVPELDKRLAGFSLVVNHMDALNTNADYDDVEDLAKRMMLGHCGSLVCEGEEWKPVSRYGKKSCVGNIFYTIAGGRYKDLAGFDIHMRQLLSDRDAMMNLKATTAAFKMKYLSENINEKAVEEISALGEKRERLQKKYDSEYKSKLSDYELYSTRARSKADIACGKAHTIAYSHIRKIGELIKSSKIEFTPEQFSEKTTEKVKSAFGTCLSAVAECLAHELSASSMSVREFLRRPEYKTYAVPAPRKVNIIKERGIGERALFTAINFVFLNFSIEDKHYMVKEWEKGYENTAVNHMERTLGNPLIDDISRYKEHWLELNAPKKPSRDADTPEIREIGEQIEWLKDLMYKNGVKNGKIQ